MRNGQERDCVDFLKYNEKRGNAWDGAYERISLDQSASRFTLLGLLDTRNEGREI